MAGIRRSDERLLARLAVGLWELDDLPSFRAGILTHLQRLLDCEVAAYNEIGADPSEVFVVATPSDTLTGDSAMFDAFAELVLQNPLAAHYARTGETRTLRLSDFISRRKFHALELYDLVYRHTHTEHQLAFTVPSGEQLIAVTVNRGERDFDDREVALLDAARALVIPAYRNLHDRARLDAIVRALDGADQGPFAIFLVEANGVLQPAHERAERLLGVLCKDATTIDALRGWAQLQRRAPTNGSAPLRLATRDRSWEARYVRGTPGALDAIAIRPLQEPSRAFRSFGLTRRQAEVLQLVLEGATNADIALALTISEHTVRHHLENIYSHLGVKSRAAAAHLATRALSLPLNMLDREPSA